MPISNKKKKDKDHGKRDEIRLQEQIAKDMTIDHSSKLPFKRFENGTGQEVMVLTIKLKDRVIEAVIREKANLPHICELISLFGDFKSYPKKFKEIFTNYVRTEYNNIITKNKLVIIPTNPSITTGFSLGTATDFPASTNETIAMHDPIMHMMDGFNTDYPSDFLEPNFDMLGSPQLLPSFSPS